MHTDALEHGLGAVLYQQQEDETMRVIAYASHSLSNAEHLLPLFQIKTDFVSTYMEALLMCKQIITH